MISFDIPKQLNGAQLIDELLAQGVEIEAAYGFHKDVQAPKIKDDKLWLAIKEKDENKAAQIVANHKGVDSIPTIDDKLASVGLNLNDLKTALGLA